MEVCRPCIGLDCFDPDDLAAGINNAVFSAVDYSFEIECPDGCYCPPGLFPQTITILASVIPPVIPPIDQPGFQIVLRLQGCQSLITRTLPGGSSSTVIHDAAVSMQAEWAGQQANCIAIATPGVNCETGSGFLNVCNDARTIDCPGFGPIFIAAGIYCDRLNITGMSQVEINAAVQLMKDRLNDLAAIHLCPAFRTFCNIVETILPTGGAQITIRCHNQSPVDLFDSSTIQYGDINGTPIFTSVQPSVAPLGDVILISFSGPIGPNPFTLLNHGVIFFTDPNFSVGHDRQVDLFVNCG